MSDHDLQAPHAQQPGQLQLLAALPLKWLLALSHWVAPPPLPAWQQQKAL